MIDLFQLMDASLRLVYGEAGECSGAVMHRYYHRTRMATLANRQLH